MHFFAFFQGYLGGSRKHPTYLVALRCVWLGASVHSDEADSLADAAQWCQKLDKAPGDNNDTALWEEMGESRFIAELQGDTSVFRTFSCKASLQFSRKCAGYNLGKAPAVGGGFR